MSKPKLHLCFLPSSPIFEQLKLEEALLRVDTENWCLINPGAPPSIVLGISSDPHLHINQDEHSKTPLPIIRRFSGGGSVVVDENTFFITLICNVSALNIPCVPQKILEWNGSHYKKLLDPHGLTLFENDYVLQNRKFGGNAQYLTKNRWLHHSSLLWDYSKERMQLLSRPPKMPKYRNERDHETFLCSLKDFIPSREVLASQIIHSLEEQFQIQEVSSHKLDTYLTKPHRQSVHYITMS